MHSSIGISKNMGANSFDPIAPDSQFSSHIFIVNRQVNCIQACRSQGINFCSLAKFDVYILLILNAVQVKTAKPHLKQLQQCVQSLSNQPEEKAGPVMTSDLSGVGRGSADDFLWLTRHHAYITVYLVSQWLGVFPSSMRT